MDHVSQQPHERSRPHVVGFGFLPKIVGGRDVFEWTAWLAELELGKPGGPLEDISAADDLWEKTKPNNMWARSFVRLLRDMVHVIRGGTPDGEPATFRDGWQIQRVLDAIRGGRGVQLD